MKNKFVNDRLTLSVYVMFYMLKFLIFYETANMYFLLYSCLFCELFTVDMNNTEISYRVLARVIVC